MELNLPIFERLADKRSILVAGMGGGFDVFCGLPIYFTLRERGLNVHLANYSFSDVAAVRGGQRLTASLVGVSSDVPQVNPYFPEHFLAEWFNDEGLGPVTVWTFQKTGAVPLVENYRRLAEHLALDAIVLVDGGVDSLVRGDEAQKGTLLEDALSLFAVDALSGISERIVACTAFGAELDLTYAHILENMAALARAGGFLGACALTAQMLAYQRYEEAVLYVQSQPYHDESVINSSIISAVRGNYGDYHLTRKTLGSRLWISPLMPLYWFFDFQSVVKENRLLSQLAGTNTFMDAVRAVQLAIPQLPRRPAGTVPL